MTAPQHPGPPPSGQFPPGPSHGTPGARVAPGGYGQVPQWPDAPPDETGGFPALPDPNARDPHVPAAAGPAPVRRHAAADDTGELPTVRAQPGHADIAPVVAGQRYSPTGEFPVVVGQRPAPPAEDGARGAQLPAQPGYGSAGSGASGHGAGGPAAAGTGSGAPTPAGFASGAPAASGFGAAAPAASGFGGPAPAATGFGGAREAGSGGGSAASSFGAAREMAAESGSALPAATGVGGARDAASGFGGAGQSGYGSAGADRHGGAVSYTNGAAPRALRAPGAAPPNVEEIAAVGELVRRLTYQIESVILGKPQVVRLALTALLAEGHILLEDVPGVGKTTLARSIAASVQGQWRRIQFTPDLLPSDVTGVTIFNQGTRGFEFHPGPVFANIVIADEINRASPKTQSALLEVMEERNVTVDGVRHGVPRPFLVVATQNPIEMDGTYRLPEAQLDRFLVKLAVGYPSEAVEIEVLKGAAAGRSPESIDAVTDTATIAQVVQLAHRVHIADPLYAYAVRLGAATRVHPQVRVGVSPRGVIALTRAACAFALTDGRPYVVPEDIKALVEPVFAHRLLLSPDAQVRAVTAGDILREVLEAVAVPAPA